MPTNESTRHDNNHQRHPCPGYQHRGGPNTIAAVWGGGGINQRLGYPGISTSSSSTITEHRMRRPGRFADSSAGRCSRDYHQRWMRDFIPCSALSKKTTTKTKHRAFMRPPASRRPNTAASTRLAPSLYRWIACTFWKIGEPVQFFPFFHQRRFQNPGEAAAPPVGHVRARQ